MSELGIRRVENALLLQLEERARREENSDRSGRQMNEGLYYRFFPVSLVPFRSVHLISSLIRNNVRVLRDFNYS